MYTDKYRIKCITITGLFLIKIIINNLKIFSLIEFHQENKLHSKSNKSIIQIKYNNVDLDINN
jgi:hypothetical protein